MKRFYDQWIYNNLRKWRQMVFLAGPRQVGKTTCCLHLRKKMKNFYYFNWDAEKGKKAIKAGQTAIAEEAGLLKAQKGKPLLVFDEIHKFGRWKQFLKGFFDIYGTQCHILVTGSAKLNIYKRSGDSMMGRYFLYRMHPLSVGELLRPRLTSKGEADLIKQPAQLSKRKLKKLFDFGGFPEPFIEANKHFSSRWQHLRLDLLIREDIRDLSQIQELTQLEMLATILIDHIGKQTSQSALANQIHVSVPTIGRWLRTLESFYYCFSIKPWSKNVRRSLRKEPKYFVWDWALIKDPGARFENFIASHLLKAVHFWTDYGLGEFGVYYIRDKDKREVDFLVTKDRKSWFLVEAKLGNDSAITKSLYHFQKETGAAHAFQVCFDMEFVDKNCFSYRQPVIVPASTFLSQLV